MTPLQFSVPRVSKAWASSRETHIAVATAIHALVGEDRPAQVIWERPTSTEWHAVTMAVQSYVDAGVFPAEEDGRYAWGNEAVTPLDDLETWRAWIDGARDSAVLFYVPRAGLADVAELGARALGVNVSAALNVARV